MTGRRAARRVAVAGAVGWLVTAGCGRGGTAENALAVDQAGAPAGAHLAPDSAQSQTPLLLAAGDIARCGRTDDEATAKLLDTLPGTVLTLGDYVYKRQTPETFATCYNSSWGRHRARTRPTPGNHEYRTARGASYFGYFGEAAGPGRRGYYSFDVAGWHVVSLNSNVDLRPNSPQLRWLRADLAAHPTRCTLAYWHHPRFSSGEHGSNTLIAPLWRALYDAGVDVVLQAHDHSYERFAPLDADGRPDAERGIRSFVVGTGGAQLTEFSRVVPGSEARYAGGHGVLKLSLWSDRYAWEFVGVRAGFEDRGEGRCH